MNEYFYQIVDHRPDGETCEELNLEYSPGISRYNAGIYQGDNALDVADQVTPLAVSGDEIIVTNTAKPEGDACWRYVL